MFINYYISNRNNEKAKKTNAKHFEVSVCVCEVEVN